MYKQIHHVSLEVKKLKRARSFYEKVLRFEVSEERPDFDFEGIWYNLGGTQLHLIVNSSLNEDAMPTLNSRSAHFAIRVDSVQELIDRLEKAGCTYLDKPASKTGWHQVFVQDPDGNIIEFNA
ncbi:VOC family protein [Pseudalkalibacillus berkeleyi]|uniref:VOC family protein n=1 Tax=Pseudalkalibacillus berkeleyi TaxID=1069813 RepID=A0ABS9H323_9BACL|nr:VOC family protein [Pseudalkalibacillus berkeleyi]MCF6138360.1 VOC family protein [Pseudalkalibacillus berkeleyi]